MVGAYQNLNGSRDLTTPLSVTNATFFLQNKQEAQLPQRDRAMRYVSKFVLCFTSYGSYKGFNKCDLNVAQGY